MMSGIRNLICIPWLALALCMPMLCAAQDGSGVAGKNGKTQNGTRLDAPAEKPRSGTTAGATKPNPLTRTSEDPEADSKSVSAAVLALEARLKALDEEEAALSDLSRKLSEGEEVSCDDLMKTWLPPAVYLVDLNDDDPHKELTGEAAGNVREILDDKEDELEKLYALKTEMEGGQEEAPPVLEAIDALGLENPEEILAKEEKDLETMRTQLQHLRLNDRFRRSADLAEAMDDDQTLLQAVARDTGEAKNAGTQHEEPDEASADSSRAVAVNLMKLAESCYRAGHYEKALEVFTNIDHAAHDEGDRVLYMMGRCAEKTGNLETARKHYREVGKVYPDSFWAKEAKFAIKMVDWKQEVGDLKGLPPELLRVLGNDVTINDTTETGSDHD